LHHAVLQEILANLNLILMFSVYKTRYSNSYKTKNTFKDLFYTFYFFHIYKKYENQNISNKIINSSIYICIKWCTVKPWLSKYV